MYQRKDTNYYKRRVFCYALFIAQGGFLFGFGLTQSVSILFYNPDPTVYDLYSIAAVLAAVFGSASGYWLITYGRRRTAILAAVVFAGALILAILPIEIPEYHIFPKFLQGLSVGYESFITPLFSKIFRVRVYQLAPIVQRGQLMALFQMMITFGVFYAQLMEIWFKSYTWYDISEEGQVTISPVGFPLNLVYSLGVFGLPFLLCVIIVLVFKFCY